MTADSTLVLLEKTVRRFPLTLASSTAFVILMIYLIEKQFNPNDGILKLLIILSMGVPLFTALHLITEAKAIKRVHKILLNGLGVLALAVYFFLYLPKNIDLFTGGHINNIVLHQVVLYLIAFSSPYLVRNSEGNFRTYLRKMVLRFALSFIFSAIVYMGITVILSTINYLFTVNIKPELNLQLWFVTANFVGLFYFLAGVPANFDDLGQDQKWLDILKIATEYILIPLNYAYLVILYLYLLKILITRTWPEDGVSNIILGYSIFSIFTWALVPNGEDKINLITKYFKKLVFASLIPLAITLLIAIGIRISAYGYTERRYLLLILGIWLLLSSVYFALTKTQSLKYIFTSLVIIVFVSSIGPQSAVNVSRVSQLTRFKDILAKNGMLIDGVAIPPKQAISVQDAYELRSIISYLGHIHNFSGIENSFPNMQFDNSNKLVSEKETSILTFLNLPDARPHEQSDYLYLSTKDINIMDISGYDVMLKMCGAYQFGTVSCSYEGTDIKVLRTNDVIQIVAANESINFNLNDIVKNANLNPNNYNYEIDPKDMDLVEAGSNYRVKLYITSLSGYLTPDGTSIKSVNSVDGYVLIKNLADKPLPN
ncbi:hypothetical protein A2716_05165 [candidate division WWE3 bacterium RIFCSPHIGHO2_01_FULL_40_23]|uniref:DUF4153 domain-containing protein n=1 Tax=candidate division WWE3 bacterium RIFCSPLOWO2_01_FULL_41_18 TaxID=1802625 RepID=A0A1F4VE94_UNCKA|nr:MAG: hypothetical protein A2716_05165 [candidate division WWE3 bacterium RIFCSPHIGHO2_01_FULL_40_23]OGC55260.1 MAG: hypothetical protein A3A78_04775 [candidate division WWE3 bacterium RIFCSPLOWO2_01_FULL_41_18]